MNILKKSSKLAASLMISGTLLLSGTIAPPGLFPTTASAENHGNGPKLSLLNESTITAGAVLQKYEWRSLRSQDEVSADVQVIRVDLTAPYVKIDSMTGSSGKYTQRANVQQMSESTEAVAGINGDYYSTAGEGAPIGPQARQGQIISSPSQLTGMYAFGITKAGKPTIHSYTFDGTVTAADGESHPLTGINKTTYWREPDNMHSHVNAIYVYTSDWGSAKRADDGNTTPTEVLVRDGVVEQISENKALPMAPPEDGYILRSTHESMAFIKDHVRVGEPIEIDYRLKSKDGQAVYGPNDLNMLVGGHTLLIDKGQKAAYTRNTSSIGGTIPRSRSAVGYSQDERYAYFITVDNYQDSDGMTLPELQSLMLELGVWKGVNLDGGGSTQMVSRPLGEFQTGLVNRPEYGSARKVVNGIGVYSTAPRGELKDMLLSGKETLLIGEQASYSMKAYDTYFNPIDISTLPVQWQVPAGFGQLQGNVFTAEHPGQTEISAVTESFKKSKNLHILGRNSIGDMQFNVNQPYMLEEGESFALPVVVESLQGQRKTVPFASLDWEFIGFSGSAEDGKIHVDEVDPNRGVGYVIARYDGYSTMMTFPSGVSELWADFEQLRPAVEDLTYPQEVEGRARVVFGLPGAGYDDYVLYFDYDFSKGSGTKALYASFENDQGVQIDGKPYGMKLDLMGDNSLNWVRAQVEDGDGKTHLVDIAQDVNWHGWKEISVNFNDYNLTYPIKLKRIYVASPAQAQDEREVYGRIAVDDVSFLYQGSVPEKKNPEVTLQVGQPMMQVDGRQVELDQSAVIKNDRTLVPLRFIVDALQGQVSWNGEQKKVSLIRSDQWIELRVGEQDLIINGKRETSDIAPEIMNQRTMVPLRLVSEAFGWTVDWDNETKTIDLSI